MQNRLKETGIHRLKDPFKTDGIEPNWELSEWKLTANITCVKK